MGSAGGLLSRQINEISPIYGNFLFQYAEYLDEGRYGQNKAGMMNVSNGNFQHSTTVCPAESQQQCNPRYDASIPSKIQSTTFPRSSKMPFHSYFQRSRVKKTQKMTASHKDHRKSMGTWTFPAGHHRS